MNEWMNGELGHDSALLRLYWAGDNLAVYGIRNWRWVDDDTKEEDNKMCL